MPILLYSDMHTCAKLAGPMATNGLVVLLTAEGAAADPHLTHAFPELLVIEAGSPRFSRLNFDALALVLVDLPMDVLLSSVGRRLMETLGRLTEEGLGLAFVGDVVAVTGGVMLDGVHAGLSLVPGTAVMPNVSAVHDLHALLERMRARRTRLLALDAPVGAAYDAAADRVTVHGSGSVLLMAFVEDHADAAADTAAETGGTARLHVLTNGMTSGWPE
jgi:hypothetical protein